MGLQVREGGGGGAKFYKINAKLGCVQYSETDEHGKSVKDADGKNVKVQLNPGSATLSGRVLALGIETDEYQGAKNYALRLKLQDPTPGNPNMYVDIPFGSEANGASMFGLVVMGKLNAADLGKPVELTPWFMPAGTKGNGSATATAKDMVGCTVAQDGVKLKEDFGNGESKLPELPVVLGANGQPVKVAGKELKDKTAWDELAQNLFASLDARLKESQAQSQHQDEGIDPDEIPAAAAANAGAPARQGFAPRG